MSSKLQFIWSDVGSVSPGPTGQALMSPLTTLIPASGIYSFERALIQLDANFSVIGNDLIGSINNNINFQIFAIELGFYQFNWGLARTTPGNPDPQASASTIILWSGSWVLDFPVLNCRQSQVAGTSNNGIAASPMIRVDTKNNGSHVKVEPLIGQPGDEDPAAFARVRFQFENTDPILDPAVLTSSAAWQYYLFVNVFPNQYYTFPDPPPGFTLDTINYGALQF